MKEFIAAQDWLTVYQLPPYAPDLNPVEGVWSLLRCGFLANVAFTDPCHLVRQSGAAYGRSSTGRSSSTAA